MNRTAVPALVLGSLLFATPRAGAAVPDAFAVWGARAASATTFAALTPPARALPPILKLAATTGCVVFSRTTTDAFGEDDLPAGPETLARLELRGAPGEIGGATFGILSAANAAFSLIPGTLTGTGGAIGADRFAARAAVLVRELSGGAKVTAWFTLEIAAQAAINGGRCRLFRLAFVVPPDAKPGVYEGRLGILATGRARRDLPVRLTVRSFTPVPASSAVSVAVVAGATAPCDAAARADAGFHGLTVSAGPAKPGPADAPRFRCGFLAWTGGPGAAAGLWPYRRPDAPDQSLGWPALEPRDKVVPTVRGEAVRDGITDLAYVRTLEARLAGSTGPAADAGRALLASLRARVAAVAAPAWPAAAELDAWRDRVAAAVESLPAK